MSDLTYKKDLDEARREDYFRDKTISASGKTGTAMKYGGGAAQVAGKTGQLASRGMTYAGKGISKGADALNRTKYGAALGIPLKGIGKATEYGGKIGEKGSKALDNAGRKVRQTGDRTKDFSNNLKRARRNNPASEAKKMADTAKDLAKMATPIGAVSGAISLARQVDLLKDLPFIPAILAAILKDILDFIGVGSLPAIGTVITICVSIFIGLMMLLAGANGKSKMARGIVKRILVLIAGTGAEMLFGLNFVPIETAVVIVIYFMVLIERQQEAKSGVTKFY